jgi:hypothetical protein
MKNRTMWTSLMLAVLGICLTQAPANAQEFRGHFTLPEQVRWGLAVLPAGEYQLELNTIGVASVVEIRGQGKAVMAMAKFRQTDTASEPSALLLVRDGQTLTVRTLHMAELGTDLFYGNPAESRMLAQNRDTLRVPVTINGK